MHSDKNKTQLVDKWFTENEEKILKAAREKLHKEQQEKEKKQKTEEIKKLKELHWMKCPKCGHDMKVKKIESIEVDECKNCQGIYFDAGELDQLMMTQGDKRKSFFRKLLGPKLK